MRPDKPQFWTGGDVNLAMTEMTGVGRWESIKNLTARTWVDVNIDCRRMLKGGLKIIKDGIINDIITNRVQKSIIVAPSQSLSFETIKIGVDNISAGSFTRKVLSISHWWERNPRDMIFNNDGTRFYVIGDERNRIIEYGLATPYDISTTTFPKVPLNVGVSSRDMIFNNDGTKFYILFDSNDRISEYGLTTPYDISTATLTGATLNVGAQDTSPKAMLFNNNGTILYILGDQNNRISEYGLTTPYDISTATFTRIALNVGAQDIKPRDMIFNNNGTRLYMLGSSNIRIFEYGLTTPYDISTATFTASFRVHQQSVNPSSILFNNDGTRFYVLENHNDANASNNIFEYIIGGTIWSGNVKIRTINN